ncbi:MAG: hypothetical protein ACT4N5_05175 [Nitrosopumilaceae archaeon]
MSTISFYHIYAQTTPPILLVSKFYDSNGNGLFDSGIDQHITNWKISVNGEIKNTQYVTFSTPGTVIKVTELDPVEKNWIATTPKSVTNTMVTGRLTQVQFGNMCIDGGNGEAVGFWANQNGQTIINDNNEVDSELTLLQNLNLKDGTGADFDPTSYDELKDWLLGANSENSPYMLSAQLAAMVLNVESGFVLGNSYLESEEPGPSDFIKINTLIEMANNSLAAGDPKEIQESLKNALEEGNNGGNYIRPPPCPFTFKKNSN